MATQDVNMQVIKIDNSLEIVIDGDIKNLHVTNTKLDRHALNILWDFLYKDEKKYTAEKQRLQGLINRQNRINKHFDSNLEKYPQRREERIVEHERRLADQKKYIERVAEINVILERLEVQISNTFDLNSKYETIWNENLRLFNEYINMMDDITRTKFIDDLIAKYSKENQNNVIKLLDALIIAFPNEIEIQNYRKSKEDNIMYNDYEKQLYEWLIARLIKMNINHETVEQNRTKIQQLLESIAKAKAENDKINQKYELNIEKLRKIEKEKRQTISHREAKRLSRYGTSEQKEECKNIILQHELTKQSRQKQPQIPFPYPFSGTKSSSQETKIPLISELLQQIEGVTSDIATHLANEIYKIMIN